MEIKIKQHEIQLAVTNYIRSILTIAGDAMIDVEFAATRGPEGFTAVINIEPPKQDEPKAELVDEPVPATASAAASTSTGRKQKTLVVAEVKDKQDQAEKGPETTPAETQDAAATTTQEDPVNEQVDTEQEPQAQQQQAGGFKGFSKEKEEVEDKPPFLEDPAGDPEPETQAPPVTRKSLFGDMSKVSNS